MAPNSNNRSAARNDGQQDNNETSEFGEVYDQLCDNWKELCGQLRAFADNELQQAVRALSKDIIDDEQNIAWYNFAVRQKDELNKDINFYEIELDSLINQDDVEKFVQQFKEIRQSVQNMYNKSTMSFRICANAERPAPSSRIPIRASRDQAQSSRDQGRSNSIPASSRNTPTHQDRLRRPPSSEAASSAPVSRENLQQSRISRPISSRNQPTQQSQSMLADQSRKSLLQQPNKRANASLGQRLSPHARNYPPLENASLSKMSVATQRQPQGARNAAPPPRITVRPPVQSTRAAAPTRAIAPPSRPPSAPPSQDPQTTPSVRPPARIPDAPLRPRVPAAPLRLAAPPSQDRTPVRTAASQSMPAASPARPAVSQSKYTTPERPTVPPARIPGAPLRPRDPAAPLRPAATTSRPPATPSRPPATPSRPPATPSRPVASSSQNRPTTRKVQPSVPSAYKKDAAFMERLRKEEIKQKEQLKNRLKVIKDQKERAEEKVIAGIATRKPNKDDDIEEEQRDMDAETKEMQKQVDDFIEKMGVTIYDRPIPRSVTLAIEEIQQASTGDNPVKLLSILSVCSGLAYIKASQRLLTAVKDGLKAAVAMFKHLQKTDPLQHWIDMYTAIVTEVQEINGMLKEKYEHTNLEQYLNCGVKMAKFNEYNEKVLDSLRTELPLKNPKDMAKMVFDALLPLTYGRFCCNDSKDPGNPALEVRILRHPNILRKRDPNFMDEYVEDSWAEETSEASLYDEYARVKPTKGSPDAPMFITPPNKRIPATNVNPQKKSTLSPEYGEPSNQTPTGRPREQPATESTATATVSSSNMLGAAKRYASKSPDRHQSTQPSPSTSKGIRSTLPGKELEESVKKTDQEYEQLRNTTDLSDLIQSDSVSRNVKQKTPKKTGYVISALDHLQNLAHGKPPSTVLAAPMKNQPGYSRSQLNNLNKDIAQAVKNSPKTNVEIPVPTPTLKEPDLFYAIGWENEEDDDESLALSYRAGAMMDSNEMRELYISGQKKLLQYDIRTIEDMKRRVRDGQKFENGSDSEVDLAVSIAVAEALEESIRQDEIPLGVNKSNVDKRAAVEAVSLGLSKTGPTNDCSSPAKEVTVQPSNPAPAEPNGPNETNNLQKDNRNYPLGGITTVLYAKISQRRFEHSSLLPGSVSPPTNFAEYFCNYKKPSDATKESKSTSSLFTKAWSTVREDMHFL